MRKIITIVLILSLLLLLLGCTPEKEETKPTITPPSPSEPLRTDAAVQTDSIPVVTAPETTGKPVSSPVDTGETAGTEEAPPMTEPSTEEEGMDVQDTYTIIVDPGIGVGGN